MAFLRQHTINLYIFDEVYSALQKEIRSNHAKEAVFWASEFVMSGNPNPLWNRLFVILAEDIGPGQPQLFKAIWELYQSWKHKVKSSGYSEKQSSLVMSANKDVIEAVVRMAMASKNRIANNVVAYVTASGTHQPSQLMNINDSAIDPLIAKETNPQVLKMYQYLMQSLACSLHEQSVFSANVILQISQKQSGTVHLDVFDFLIQCSDSWGQSFIHDQLKVIVQAVRSNLGSLRLNLSLMIYMIIYYHEVSVELDQQLPQPDEKLLKKLESMFSNQSADITIRRQFAVPSSAIDKHTGRGKGSKTYVNNFHQLEKEAMKRGIDISDWSDQEKMKSHGLYLKMAKEYVTQQSQHSLVSHFFMVGSQVTPQATGYTGTDDYYDKALAAYLQVEYKYGYRAAKSSQMLTLRWPEIQKLITQPTTIALVKIPLVPKIALKMQSESKKLIPLKLKVNTVTKVAIPLKKIPIGIKSEVKSNQVLIKESNQVLIKESNQVLIKESNQVLIKESERFNFIVRAQLTTSATKMDSYFAYDRMTNNSRVFVKGPYSSIEKANNAKISCNLKKCLGLRSIHMQVAMLQPDLLVSVLGMRNSLDLSQLHPFLITECLYDGSFVTKKHKSKLWPETEVVDQYVTGVFNVLESLSVDHIREYVELIIFRYITGIGDMTDRNFLLYDNHVHSVDEDTLGKDLNLSTQLNKKRSQFCQKIVQCEIDFYNQLVGKWKSIIETDAEFKKVSGTYYNFIRNKVNEIDVLKIWV
jgi:hypothetical protein